LCSACTSRICEVQCQVMDMHAQHQYLYEHACRMQSQGGVQSVVQHTAGRECHLLQVSRLSQQQHESCSKRHVLFHTKYTPLVMVVKREW
jgi:hypothetical protein